MSFLRIGALAALVLAIAGCGAKTQAGSLPAGAELVPASAAVYAVVSTDTASPQWRQADRLFSRFPGRGKLLAQVRTELREDKLDWARDVKPALGAELNVVALSYEGDEYVYFTKPKDEAKFVKLIELSDPYTYRTIDGWTVFAERKASLDRYEAALASGDRLTDDDAFQKAMKGLPEDSALLAYLGGEGIRTALEREAGKGMAPKALDEVTKTFGTLESVSFAASAEDDGVAVEAAYVSNPEAEIENFSATLDDELPAGPLFVYSFGSLEDTLARALDSADKEDPSFRLQRSRLESVFGLSAKDDVLPLLSQEGAIAVYKDEPIPEDESIPGLVLLLAVDDEAKARDLVKRLSALAELSNGVTPRTFEADGAEVTKLNLGTYSLFITVGDGKVVVTTTEKLLRDTLGDGEKLADDPVYTAARASAKAPDETAGTLYANLDTAIGWAFDYSEREGDPVPPDAMANTKPLQSVFLYTERDGNRVSLTGFLTIK